MSSSRAIWDFAFAFMSILDLESIFAYSVVSPNYSVPHIVGNALGEDALFSSRLSKIQCFWISPLFCYTVGPSKWLLYFSQLVIFIYRHISLYRYWALKYLNLFKPQVRLCFQKVRIHHLQQFCKIFSYCFLKYFFYSLFCFLLL